MLVIAGNLRLGAHETRRAYLGSTPVFAAEQTRWGTDFREYATGSPPGDWTSYSGPLSGHLTTWEITTGGLVSDNRMRIRKTTPDQRAAQMSFFSWDELPEAADSEILLLVERGGSNVMRDIFGAGQRMSLVSDTDNSGLFLGFGNTDNSRIMQRSWYNSSIGSGVNGAGGGTIPAGSTLWMRVRWDGDRFRIRTWDVDTKAGDLGLSDEPLVWQLDDTNDTLPAAGAIGLAFRVSNTTAAQGEVFCHYFGVGIDGDTAPSPAFAPGPAPIPNPTPDPGTFETFDSTATSFDSTAHTFDEVE
jgi:hypothetical protein